MQFYIALECLDLKARGGDFEVCGCLYVGCAGAGGDVVVGGREGEGGLADGEVTGLERSEGLGGGNFMNQVAVDVEKEGAVGARQDGVGGEELFIESDGLGWELHSPRELQ